MYTNGEVKKRGGGRQRIPKNMILRKNKGENEKSRKKTEEFFSLRAPKTLKKRARPAKLSSNPFPCLFFAVFPQPLPRLFLILFLLFE